MRLSRMTLLDGRAAEAVGCVPKAVLMEGACRQHHGGGRKRGREPGSEIQQEGEAQHGRRQKADDEARDRDDPHQARKTRQRMGVLLPWQGWHGKPGIEANAMG
jgi:hypothetical protein